jgi:O-antigen biosynthesis protein WbqP
VRLTSPGPVLYWSNRVGRRNVIFRMPKFRSMRIDTPTVATHLLEDPSRYLTPIGGFLRKSSLDELPIPQKVEFDVDYLRRRSFVMDMRILAMTVGKVLGSKGITH